MAKLYVMTSSLMAIFFLLSASVQFNDPGWYRWITMYTGAAYVNVVNGWSSSPMTGTIFIGNVIKSMGELFLSHVILDDYLISHTNTIRIWSLDLRHRVVREKIGCILVILCMIMQISAAQLFHDHPTKKKNMEVSSSIKNGMALLVAISFGLCVGPLMYPKEDIKFY